MPPDPSSIELAVYSCVEDGLLFAPALLQPSIEAEAMFGPLARRGTVSVGVDDEAWASILAQIDRHSFATIPRLQAELLAGMRLTAAPL